MMRTRQIEMDVRHCNPKLLYAVKPPLYLNGPGDGTSPLRWPPEKNPSFSRATDPPPTGGKVSALLI
jgi:hypothetical protein